MEKERVEIKDRLREALDLRGMTQQELSNKTGIPKGSISQYLSGYVNPKSDRLLKMANVLNVSELWLRGYDVDIDINPLQKNYSYLTVEHASFDDYNERFLKYRELIRSKLENIDDEHIVGLYHFVEYLEKQHTCEKKMSDVDYVIKVDEKK